LAAPFDRRLEEVAQGASDQARQGIMMLQAVISVVTLTAVAGSAINIFAGAK
jgi:hypothetical protein